MKSSVSCIIPCYNSQKYITKTIKSVLNQTIKPLEIILINDKSTDNTLQILKDFGTKYDDLIRIIDLKENKGSSFARNYAVQYASGDYVFFMDSDDLAEPQSIEKYLYRLEEINSSNLEYKFCYSG